MENFLSKLLNSYVMLFIMLISCLVIGYTLAITPKQTPITAIQLIGVYFFVKGIDYIVDILIKTTQKK